MQLIGVADDRPGLASHLCDCLGVKPAEIAEAFDRPGFRWQRAPHGDRAGPPLFQRSIIEKSKRVRIEQLMGEWRRLAGVEPDYFYRSGLEVPEHAQPSLQIRALMQAIVNGV